VIVDIGTGVQALSREESGGCLSTGQAVSGVEVARARSGRWCGTWEPLAAMRLLGMLSRRGAREGVKRREPRDAEYRCVAGGRTAS